jgi:hypothetical protein
MTTQYIFLPPTGGTIPIYGTPLDLPVAGTLGEVVSVISDGSVRQWNGTTWNAIGGLASVADTNSLDLTNTGGVVSGQVKLSAASAGAGNQKVPISIETDGLLAVIPIAATAVSGALTSTDWNTFNNKVSTTRTIATTAPLAGGGDLSANRTLSITQANTTTNGFLSSTDWNTFNGKQQAITIGAVGAGDALGVTLSAGTLSLQAATNSLPGIVTATAQTLGGSKTFNNNLLKANNATNASFVGLVAPSASFATAANLQSATVTLGGSQAFTFQISLSSGECLLVQGCSALSTLTCLSDMSNLFLTSDAGTGIFVSKSTASSVITIKNRMGASRDIGVVFFGNTVTSSTVWA